MVKNIRPFIFKVQYELLKIRWYFSNFFLKKICPEKLKEKKKLLSIHALKFITCLKLI